MAAHWWWTWSIGLPSSAYANSQWSLSNTTSITTNNTDNLNSPPASANAPGEEFNLEIVGPVTIDTPVFPTGPLSTGWFISRWNNAGTANFNTAIDILVLQNNATNVIRLVATTSAVTSTLSLQVNGTLVGTTTAFYGDAAEVLAIDFDLTTTPPKAGLVVSGIREINLTAGSGSPTTVNRVRFNSGHTGGGNAVYYGDFALFDDLNDFTNVAETQDVWVTYLDANEVTDADNSWTPTSGTDVSVISDSNIATYTQSLTDPDTLTIGFESTTDRQTGWTPTIIYGASVVAYASAQIITDTTLTMSDANGTIDSSNDTLNAVGRFIEVYAPLDSQNITWDVAMINSITADYDVSS